MGSESGTPPLVVVVGETASGKTAASIKIAQKVGGEIICADSRTVYKQMNIGTAKPSKEEQKLVPHHLIDVVEPSEKFSAAEFKRQAQKCIQEITDRGNIPILVGGTGLYVDSVLYNFQFANASNDEMREHLEQMSDEELTTLLSTKNIDTATLNTKNRRHVIRAIERGESAPVNRDLRPNTIILGMKLDRDELKDRVTTRVEQMFNQGFLDESRELFEVYGTELEAFRTPGYKAVQMYFAGDISEDEAKEEFIRSDLALAKRQRTWFKRNQNILWFDDPSGLIDKAVEFTSLQSL